MQDSSPRLWLLSAALPALASASGAQSTKLNAPFPPGPPRGTVTDFRVSPDGARVVYLADQEADERFELYVRPADGSGAPLRLGQLPEGAQILDFDLAPDGVTVLHRVHRSGTIGLFSAVLDGSRPVRELDPRVAPAASVEAFAFRAAGAEVVLRRGTELLRARADGSTVAVRISADLEARDPVLSPDGSWTVFGTTGGDLYSVPTDGSLAPVQLSGGESLTGGHLVSPDGSRVLYLADEALFSVRIDGSAPPIFLQGSVPGGHPFQPQHLEFDATGSRILYHALGADAGTYSARIDGGASPLRIAPSFRYVTGAQTPFVVYAQGTELHSVRADGTGGPVLLDAAGPVANLQLSPTGDRVVWTRGIHDDELHSAPVDGSGPALRLDPILPGLPEVRAPRIGPDGARVTYLSWTGLAMELLSVPIDGSAAALRVSGASQMVDAELLRRFSPDGAFVFFGADRELFRAPLDGGPGLVVLNGALAPVPVEDVVESATTGDGSVVLYRTRAGGEGGLFRVAIDGSAPALRLDDLGGTSTWVEAFALAPGDEHAVFVTGPVGHVDAALYGVPIDGSSPPVRLDGGLVPGGDVGSFRITPDARHVLFEADRELDGKHELYLAPIDGAAPPRKLNPPLAAGGDVWGAEIGPAGERAIYLAVQAPSTVVELYSVPLDGSAPPVLLSTSQRRPTGFRLHSGSERLVYWTGTSGARDLFSVPVDGSQPALRLTPSTLESTTTWYDFDARHVVFLAQSPATLYSRSIEGGAPPLRLSPTSPHPVTQAVLDPTGTHVLFVQGSPEELFSVPVDLGRPPRRLNPALAPGQRVWPVPPMVSPDGSRVLFHLLGPGESLLHLAPVRGSAPAVRLDPRASSTGAAGFSPDGQRVAYLETRPDTGQTELFTVPAWGGVRVRLSGPLTPAGDVLDFHFTPGSGCVVYRADQGTDTVLELYASPLPSIRVRPAR